MPPTARFLDRHSAPHISTLVMIAGLSALSMNIFLPSLPGMASYFGVSYGVMQQSVSLYLLLSALLQLLIGPLADRFGRRPVLLVSAGLFLLFSLGTIFAPTAGVFLICRMGQAVIAAGMVLSRAIVRDIVPDEEAASMIAYVTMGMSIVPMFGPVIGGFLDQYFGWQANFTLLFVVGLMVTLLTYLDLGETARVSDQTIWGQFRQYPQLLRSPRFWGYSLSAAFTSGTFFAYLGGAPFVGREVFHLSSVWVGSLFALTAVGYAAGNFYAGRWSSRIGMNRMILLGCFITFGGMVLLLVLTLFGLSSAVVFFGSMISIGIGNGVAMPNANAGIVSVRPDLAGTASGLGGAILIGAGAALAAYAGTLLQPGASELPLILLMTASAGAAILAILAVMRRARRLGLPQ